MIPTEQLYNDALASLKLWRVWTFLGVQDIKARFRRSFIGPLWILLNLAFFVGGAGFVYGVMFGQPMADFLPFLITGFVIWGFLLSSFVDAGAAFVGSEGYIKQFSYPKQIYLLRALVSYCIVLMIGFSAIIPLQIFFHNFHIAGWVMAVPGLALLLVAALGHIVISAYVGTRFRDLPFALAGILQVIFFVTPIMFPIKVLQAKHLDFVYQYNPLYYLIDIVRHPILEGGFPPSESYALATLYALAVWIVAAVVARRLDNRLVFLL
ncbi:MULTISPECIES: ABC transporter permease [unclassified Mesorhizobium]|uniref:ABC transporter permease n=1 Tax=unclassified Mesorhizobium TaxID=325217 RepID=UPI000FCC15CA|nr:MULTISPECIES: ABC transporter permease [unclassified Mesorhizobium]RUX96607.1 ABC transporter permease [Mesorhizobium sp. M7D.F.Ca.US.004.01.2.1]RVA25121.1 ABC transporter permease [Mesorhizobium sp. M7D.F.Ca.US.004.03.1.1]